MSVKRGLAIGGVCLVAASCTFAPPPADPVSTTDPRAGGPATVDGLQVLPLHKLVITDKEKSRFFRAVGKMTNDCLEDAGAKPVFRTRPGPVAEFTVTGLLGVMTNERAEKHGYGLSRVEQEGLNGIVPGDLTAYRRDPEISDKTKDLIEGEDGTSGCLAKGAAQVVAKVPGAPSGSVVQEVLADPLLMSLIQQAEATAVQDAALSQALAGWRDCMGAAGYTVGHPATVVQDLNLKPKVGTQAGGEPDAEEKSVALADVRCKGETKLVPAWNAAVLAEQQALVQQYDQKLGVIAGVKRLYVDGAMAVLGEE